MTADEHRTNAKAAVSAIDDFCVVCARHKQPGQATVFVALGALDLNSHAQFE